MVGFVLFSIGSAGLITIIASLRPSVDLGDHWYRGSAGEATQLDEATAAGYVDRLVRRITQVPAIKSLISENLRQDLAIVGTTTHDFVRDLVIKVTTGVFLGLLAISRLGGTGVLLLWAAIGMAVLGSVQSLRRKAEEMRIEMITAVTGYLEFVRLVGQTSSVEGAMREGLKYSTSWPFERMRAMVAITDRGQEPPWVGLAELGRRYGVPALDELGGVLQIASRESTAIAEAVEAKSEALRRIATENEIARADSATSMMVMPMSLGALAVMGLILTSAIMRLPL